MRKEDSIFFIIVFLFLVSIIYFNYERNCRTDTACFDEAAQKCSRAKYQTEEDNNVLEYKILGKEASNCKVQVTIVQVDPEASYDTISRFQGKSMTCLLPEVTSASQSKDIINYCSGPLKEAMYELIIQKLYSYVAQNIGDIISQLKETI